MIEETVNLDTPWGSYNGNGADIAFIRFCVNQLMHYLAEGSSPDRAYTLRDIAAYEELIGTGRDENARNFLTLKAAHRRQGRVQIENRTVIDQLKGAGVWLRAAPPMPPVLMI